MISWLFIIPTFFAGVTFGIFAISLCHAGHERDDILPTEKRSNEIIFLDDNGNEIRITDKGTFIKNHYDGEEERKI